MSDIREGSLEPGSERLPAGFWLQAGPFAILGAAALWLRARWDDLPARIPVHWNIHGQADRFVAHGSPAIATPLIVGVLACAVTLAIAVGIRRSSPRGPLRAPTLRVLLAAEYLVACICSAALLPSVTEGRLFVHFLVFTFAAVAALVVGTFIDLARMPLPMAPRNPNAWRAHFFYFDRADPALFVPKRHGFGYTINFGHRAALPLLAATLVLPLLALLFVGLG
jgi:uncharacterized membrane protein